MTQALRHRSRADRGSALRPLLLAAGIASALAVPHVTHAAAASPATADASASAIDASFDRNLLSGAGNNTSDLSRFERGNVVMPGMYNVDVYLNQSWIGRRDMRFAAPNPNANAVPCLDAELYDKLGLHLKKSSEVQSQLADASGCTDIGSVIKDATMSVDMSRLRVDVSVPQAYIDQTARGYVDPESWDPGVAAGLLNYNFTGYRSTSGGNSLTTSYLGLNAGFNVGLWQFRQDSTVTWQSASGSSSSHTHWDNIRTYVQRDLPGLRAVLTVGDSFTDGQVFDTYGIRGVQLATDDRMLPDSLRGYAPVVRGIAETNALVTVRQNGVQIYQTTVAPGPFSISDLYPTGYGGNLDVVVTEADGRVRTFTVPYASIAQLLRPGVTRYSIVAGQLRNTGLEHQPDVVQGTLQHGINNLLTGYAGVVASQGYGAALVGAAFNTRFGAIGLDLTASHAEIPNQSSHSGESLRVSYSKIVTDTRTSLSVAAYRYSTSGYLSLTDAATARDYAMRGLNAFNYVAPTAPTIDGVPVTALLTPAQQAALTGTTLNDGLSDNTLQRQRNRFDLTLSQPLGSNGGTLFVSGSANDYWNRSGTDTQFQAGYSNSFHHISYGINATRTRDVLGRYSNGYFVNVNIPLGTSAHAPTLMLNMNHDAISGSQEQALLNGSLGDANQFSYGVSASHGEDAGSSGSANASYRSPFAVFNASVGSGNGYSQASVGVNGSLVVHSGGVVFGQPMGDTVAIVEAPNAAGARLLNANNSKINSAGYGLVPYLTPYSLNTIQIDPKGLPLDVQLDATSAQVAPYAGSVVLVKFKTQNGRTVIFRVRQSGGASLPFGAEVVNEAGVTLGLVGQGGQILARGVNTAGMLTAQWHDEDGSEHACSFSYNIGLTAKDAKSYQEIPATCTPRGASLSEATRNAP